MSLMITNCRLLLLLLCICSSALLVQSQEVPKCRPSQFWIPGSPFNPGSGKCYDCSPGYYCPDGNKEYQCPDGSISPESGAVICKHCNNSTGSDILRTACFLPGTPKNIRTFHSNILDNVNVTAQEPLFFYVIPNRGGEDLTITLLFHGAKEYPVTIFGSSVTGRPTPTNFEMVSSSVKPRFMLKDYPSDKLVYFTLVTPFTGIMMCNNCI